MKKWFSTHTFYKNAKMGWYDKQKQGLKFSATHNPLFAPVGCAVFVLAKSE